MDRILFGDLANLNDLKLLLNFLLSFIRLVLRNKKKVMYLIKNATIFDILYLKVINSIAIYVFLLKNMLLVNDFKLYKETILKELYKIF